MEKEEQLKEAFQKIKQDIDYLKKENVFFRDALIETREKMSETIGLIKQLADVNFNLLKILEELKQNKSQLSLQNNPLATIRLIPTHPHIIPTHPHIIPTHPADISPLKDQILDISTGNEGGPTDRQTDQQTDRPIDKSSHNKETSIENAYKLLDSLDSLKKEIRLKFKKLTDQELLIFSMIYQLEEEQGFANYKSLSNKLNLTESSIRDYVGRLIKKEVPINKIKLNNKIIQLSISKNLKKIASLQTILNLRDI